MFFESLPENITIVVIALQCPYLGHSAKPLKRLVIEFIDVRKVRIGQDNVREFLHVSKAMRDSERAALIAVIGQETGRKKTDLVGSSVRT